MYLFSFKKPSTPRKPTNIDDTTSSVPRRHTSDRESGGMRGGLGEAGGVEGATVVPLTMDTRFGEASSIPSARSTILVMPKAATVAASHRQRSGQGQSVRKAV